MDARKPIVTKKVGARKIGESRGLCAVCNDQIVWGDEDLVGAHIQPGRPDPYNPDALVYVVNIKPWRRVPVLLDALLHRACRDASRGPRRLKYIPAVYALSRPMGSGR